MCLCGQCKLQGKKKEEVEVEVRVNEGVPKQAPANKHPYRTEIKRALVALDKAEDSVVEVEAGVPDQGPVAEDPQHHPAACCVSDSPAKTGAETESNPRSQSEPWCYRKTGNLRK